MTANEVVSVEALDEKIGAVEAEIAENERAADAALARIEAGDDGVSPDELPRLRGLGEFLAARLRGLRARRERAAADRRLSGIARFRAEVERQVETDVAEIEAAEAEVRRAVARLVVAVSGQKGRVEAWTNTLAKDHAVPSMPGSAVEPSPRHGGCAPGPGGLRLGDRRIRGIEVDQAVRLAVEAGRKLGAGVDPAEVPAGIAARIVETVTVLPEGPGVRYYLSAGGGVIPMDRPPTEHERAGLTRELSRDEVLARSHKAHEDAVR